MYAFYSSLVPKYEDLSLFSWKKKKKKKMNFCEQGRKGENQGVVSTDMTKMRRE